MSVSKELHGVETLSSRSSPHISLSYTTLPWGTILPASTFEIDMSPDAIRLKTSAANPSARVLFGMSDRVEIAAVARSSSTTPPDEGTVTRDCKRRREDKANTTACTQFVRGFSSRAERKMTLCCPYHRIPSLRATWSLRHDRHTPNSIAFKY